MDWLRVRGFWGLRPPDPWGCSELFMLRSMEGGRYGCSLRFSGGCDSAAPGAVRIPRVKKGRKKLDKCLLPCHHDMEQQSTAFLSHASARVLQEGAVNF